LPVSSCFTNTESASSHAWRL